MHRTTIAAPQALIDEALQLGRQVGLSSLNAVVQVALEEFAERRRREAFAAAMVEMASDPDVLRESAQITALFRRPTPTGLASTCPSAVATSTSSTWTPFRAEQAGTRPVLVLSVDALNDLPLVVTVVVGTRGSHIARDYPSNVRVEPANRGCGSRPCSCAFNPVAAHTRFTSPRAGVLASHKLAEVEQAIRYCLGL